MKKKLLSALSVLAALAWTSAAQAQSEDETLAAVEKVARDLVASGHGSGDLYFNYYANQILYQVGGDQWKQWNAKLNGFLKGSQAHGGHLEGSWHYAGADHGSSSGGRLYCTAMATMSLAMSPHQWNSNTGVSKSTNSARLRCRMCGPEVIVSTVAKTSLYQRCRTAKSPPTR